MPDPQRDADSEPDPRYLFANERTFLAWLRTALAFVVAGLAAVTVKPHVHHTALLTVVATLGCLVGASGAIASYLRWRQAEVSIRRGTPLPRPFGGLAMVIALVVFSVGALVVVFTQPK